MLEQLDLTQLIFGRLSWDAIPLHDPVIVATFVVVAIGGAALLGALTYYRVWGYLWKEWFTSIDHKKIGIMYMVLGLVMLLRAASCRRPSRHGRCCSSTCGQQNATH